MLGPTLETPRLLLRPPNAEDFAAFAAFMADPRTAEHLGGVQSPLLAWRSLATIIGGWTLRGYSLFSFIEKQTGRWVGRGGAWMPEGWPGTEVGWGVVADAQRQGYAKEAASAVLDWVFDELGWREAVHCILPENVASIATAHSLGSTLLRRGVRAARRCVRTRSRILKRSMGSEPGRAVGLRIEDLQQQDLVWLEGWVV